MDPMGKGVRGPRDGGGSGFPKGDGERRGYLRVPRERRGAGAWVPREGKGSHIPGGGAGA